MPGGASATPERHAPARDREDHLGGVAVLVPNAVYFERGTHDYLENPKVRIHIADGRHFLASAREPYDIISINVSDPYLPGSSSLFSSGGDL